MLTRISLESLGQAGQGVPDVRRSLTLFEDLERPELDLVDQTTGQRQRVAVLLTARCV